MVTEMTRQQKHRLKRRAIGLCGYEGCPDRAIKTYYCADHTKWHREYRRYLRKRAALRKSVAANPKAAQTNS
jgi:hypothetical protein